MHEERAMISLNIRRWTLGQLVGVSAGYWAVLAAAALGPFSRAVYTIARLGGERGTATGSFNDGIVTLTALKDGVAVYTGSAPILEIALWIALPPLGLWLAWLASRPSRAKTLNASAAMLIEQRTVSRKTPLDGKLEISAATAARLQTLGTSFPLRTAAGEGSAQLIEMSCTCTKASVSGEHRHHFIESELLRALEANTDVRVALDDARPGSLSIEPA
jgi:hypothetical protein